MYMRIQKNQCFINVGKELAESANYEVKKNYVSNR